MLLTLVNDPKVWRGRAEEARALAEQMKDTEARNIMWRIAQDYDRLAQCAEAAALV